MRRRDSITNAGICQGSVKPNGLGTKKSSVGGHGMFCVHAAAVWTENSRWCTKYMQHGILRNTQYRSSSRELGLNAGLNLLRSFALMLRV